MYKANQIKPNLLRQESDSETDNIVQIQNLDGIK